MWWYRMPVWGWTRWSESKPPNDPEPGSSRPRRACPPEAQEVRPSAWHRSLTRSRFETLWKVLRRVKIIQVTISGAWNATAQWNTWLLELREGQGSRILSQLHPFFSLGVKVESRVSNVLRLKKVEKNFEWERGIEKTLKKPLMF